MVLTIKEPGLSKTQLEELTIQCRSVCGGGWVGGGYIDKETKEVSVGEKTFLSEGLSKTVTPHTTKSLLEDIILPQH